MSNPVVADGVYETSLTTGTGTYTLSNSPSQSFYQTFAVVGNGNQCWYRVEDRGNGGWENGLGTYSSTSHTLTRDLIYASSNSGNPVDWKGGKKEVFLAIPGEVLTATTLPNIFTAGPQKVHVGGQDVAVVGDSASGHSAFGPGATIDPVILYRTFVSNSSSVISADVTFTTYPSLSVNNQADCTAVLGQTTVNVPVDSPPPAVTSFWGGFFNAQTANTATSYANCTVNAVSAEAAHNGSGDLGTMTGVIGNVVNSGSGHINQLIGTDQGIFNSGSGIVDQAIGLYAFSWNTGSGTITNAYAAYLDSGGGSGYTHVYGIYIADQTVSTASSGNWNIYSDGSGAQNTFVGSVLIGGTASNVSSAVLEVDSTTRGFLPPRGTTTQKNAISSPAEALYFYDTTLHAPYYWNGSAWTSFSSGSSLLPSVVQFNSAFNGASSSPTNVLGSTPTSGNKLIAFIGCTSATVSSISQTNVSWIKLDNYNNSGSTAEGEIWIGTVSASASATATFTLSGSTASQTVIMEVTNAFSALSGTIHNAGTNQTCGVSGLSLNAGDYFVALICAASAADGILNCNLPFYPLVTQGGELRCLYGVAPAGGGMVSITGIHDAPRTWIGTLAKIS